MKTILATFLTILMLLPVSAMGEILTIKHTVKQTFGGGQSPDDARISAMAKAKREALEKAGTYIESLTVVKNAQVEKDEILALTAGVLKAEVVSQKNYASDDAFGIEIIVNVVVDTSVLEERVKKQLQDRTHLTQLKDTQNREKELLQKVAQLEEENRKLSTNNQSTERLKKEFQQASQGLTALGWFAKALSLSNEEKYSDPKKAVEYLSNAIKLRPDFAIAHAFRGLAYKDLGLHKLAIYDFDQAIRLKPDGYYAYNFRGLLYANLGQDQRAIEDFNEAIHLKQNYVAAYNNRGLSYASLGQYQQAIANYNEAIRLNPDCVPSYIGRGIAYGYLGQHQKAIDDLNKAIHLKPDDANAYAIRGFEYYGLANYQLAINDFSNAIRLEPGDADVYTFRGIAYFNLGQKQLAIEDYNKAIKLNPNYTGAYFNRGWAYYDLGQYQRAIEDYNKNIRLEPDGAVPYSFRGDAYFSQGNKKLGCRDAQKACELGDCMGLERAKGKGYCR